jgi:hypothetical protein
MTHTCYKNVELYSDYYHSVMENIWIVPFPPDLQLNRKMTLAYAIKRICIL